MSMKRSGRTKEKKKKIKINKWTDACPLKKKVVEHNKKKRDGCMSIQKNSGRTHTKKKERKGWMHAFP